MDPRYEVTTVTPQDQLTITRWFRNGTYQCCSRAKGRTFVAGLQTTFGMLDKKTVWVSEIPHSTSYYSWLVGRTESGVSVLKGGMLVQQMG